MSILQDFEEAKKLIGEEKWNALPQYLEVSNLFLDDVIYNQEEWAKFEKWYNTTDPFYIYPTFRHITYKGKTYDRVCSRCGTKVQDLACEDYDWFCPHHYEDLFNFETEFEERE